MGKASLGFVLTEAYAIDCKTLWLMVDTVYISVYACHLCISIALRFAVSS